MTAILNTVWIVIAANKYDEADISWPEKQHLSPIRELGRI